MTDRHEHATPDRPDPLRVDETVQRGFSLATWLAAAAALALLLGVAMFGFSGYRGGEPGASRSTQERAAQPERTTPPAGSTGEVSGSRSPVQR